MRGFGSLPEVETQKRKKKLITYKKMNGLFYLKSHQ